MAEAVSEAVAVAVAEAEARGTAKALELMEQGLTVEEIRKRLK